MKPEVEYGFYESHVSGLAIPKDDYVKLTEQLIFLSLPMRILDYDNQGHGLI